MPSSMTHTYFGLDVFQKLNFTCQNKIKNNLEYFKLFSQGSDPFMFYHFFIGNKAKEAKNIQYLLHTTKTRNFFITTINYIKKNNLTNNEEAMSYLYGFICHYFLDLYTHPYIYYKSGIFNPKDKNTYKYNSLHQAMEYAIDLYYISKKETIPTNKYKVHNHIFTKTTLTPILRDIIKNSIEDLYSLKNAVKYYEKSLWYMKKFFYLANYDPYKIKLSLYKLIDKITPPTFIQTKELSFNYKYSNINNYLNIEHNTWYYPWDKSISFTTSFLDLYNMAKKEAIKTIETVTYLLDNKLDYNKLNELFKDLSYVTGLPCNKKVKLKYFEF